jgi:hypothetical protein
MQRALIASGVLGLGTALVFGAAALTAMLFPNGTSVAASMNGMWVRDEMMAKPMPAPGFAAPLIEPVPPVFIGPGDIEPLPDGKRGEKD